MGGYEDPTTHDYTPTPPDEHRAGTAWGDEAAAARRHGRDGRSLAAGVCVPARTRGGGRGRDATGGGVGGGC